jgi:hypothetical protein
MELLERTRNPLTRQHAGPPGGDPPAADLSPVRDAARGLVQAANVLIDRALSGNSEEFLQANRQEGGQ